MKITFLGGGNMARALLGGLIKQGFVSDDISVIEIFEAGRVSLESDFGVRCFAAPEPAALDCDILILAVKPQSMREALVPLVSCLGTQLLISIAAALRITDISRWLGGYQRLVRAMPNTPALIGAGVTGLCAHASVDEAGRLQAEQVLSAVGSVRWVDNESLMDAVTAISGSGPAYVFYFIEALQQAGQNLGLDEATARQLSIETFFGAAKLALQSDEDVVTLRERVTSKGGTTAAALQSLEADQVKAAIIRAVEAAQVRGCDLSNQLGQD